MLSLIDSIWLRGRKGYIFSERVVEGGKGFGP